MQTWLVREWFGVEEIEGCACEFGVLDEAQTQDCIPLPRFREHRICGFENLWLKISHTDKSLDFQDHLVTVTIQPMRLQVVTADFDVP